MHGAIYPRKIEDVLDDAYTIDPEVSCLVIKGGYLLLATGPWREVKPLLDLAVFLDVPRELVRQRLLRRHVAERLFSVERNLDHVERVDLNNYDLTMIPGCGPILSFVFVRVTRVETRHELDPESWTDVLSA